ncbi:MAG TPA: ribonuclease HII, partial [Bacteroidia bacterium]|nr:ribonuclease HII [Bacteroidia bacterium]
MLIDYSSEKLIVAGCDEAGRGCLAGPVCAASVILPVGFYHPLLNDSKKMSEKSRILLREVILKEAVGWAIAMCDHAEIDKINILNASILAMQKAVRKLKIKPDLILIDGNRFKPVQGIEHKCVIGGDAIYTNIAAASVLAKTERDAYMLELHKEYPHYGWDRDLRCRPVRGR